MPLRIVSKWQFPLLLGLLLACLAGCATSPFAPHTLTLTTQPQGDSFSRPLSTTPLRQTFILPMEPAVSEIEVVLAIPDTAPALPSRPLYWEIRSVNNSLLRQGMIETAGYLHNTPVTLKFDPLPVGESIEVSFTTPDDTDLSLWRSVGDRYPQGTLIDTVSNGDGDLLFTIRAQETPLTLGNTLQTQASRWEKPALWVVLAVVTLGWCFLWLLGSDEVRPRAAAAAGVSLALIPIAYLWLSWIQLHLFFPLFQSLLRLAAVVLFLVMIRRGRQLVEALRTLPLVPLTLMGGAILLSVMTWLLAGRNYLAPPGTGTFDAGTLAQTLTRNGVTPLPAPPLPPAALTALFATVTQQQVQITDLLVFTGLVLGVAVLPALYTLAEEITEDGTLALWMIPLAWAWGGIWEAFAAGEWFALYSLALMPVAVALGLRAMRSTTHARRGLVLAAIPLAGLMLIQGVSAMVAWLIAFVVAVVLVVTAHRKDFSYREHLRPLISRAVGWLFISLTLLAPTLIQRLPVISPPEQSLDTFGYGLLITVIVISFALHYAKRWLRPVVYPSYVVLVALVLLLAWQWSAPLLPQAIPLQTDEANVLRWMKDSNTADASKVLVNVTVNEGAITPLDGMFWSPLFNDRPTVVQLRDISTDLVARVMGAGSLQDQLLREEVRGSGITYVLLGAARGPLHPSDFLNEPWARLAYQSGGAYLFELQSEANAQ